MIQIVDYATLPEKKAKPQRALIVILVMILAAVLALVIIISCQWLRNEGVKGDSNYWRNALKEFLSRAG